MNYLDSFRSSTGRALHPAAFLFRYLKESGISPEDVANEYRWDPSDFLYAGTKKAIAEGFVQPMGPREAGICGQITGIPPGIWIQACVEFYQSIGVKL